MDAGPEVLVSKLLAISFDAEASPSITLKALMPGQPGGDTGYGWGMAWYPPHDRAAVVVKDPTSVAEDALSQLLRDWERFRSTIFVCNLRGAAKRRSQEDTHPFARSYAGRDWVLTHNGQLRRSFREDLPLGDAAVAEPVGHTDSEHVLCWIIARLRQRKVRTLAALGWGELHAWLREANAFGTLNLLLTDGADVVAYQDLGAFHPLHWRRRRPPHAESVLDSRELRVDLDNALDASRTGLFFASEPLDDGAWTAMAPGQMLVGRRGAVVWDSAGEATRVAKKQIARERPAPLPLRVAVATPIAEGPAPVEAPAPAPPQAPVRAYRVTHTSRYLYANPVEQSAHFLRLHPVQDHMQQVLEFELEIAPAGRRQDFEDVFGNQASRLQLEGSFREMVVTARSLVHVRMPPWEETQAAAQRSTIPLVWMPWQRQMMMPYLLPPELPESQLTELFGYAMGFVERQDYDLEETIADMNQTIYRDFAYVPGSTTIETTPFEVYSTRRGVCQDFANLLICLARLLGVPARYRVGYIHTGARYDNKLQSDASHAWAELYLPGRGWRGYDPTNGCPVNSDHVRVAVGRNYRDATPISGTIYRGGGAETLQIDVRVEPVVDGGAA